MVRAEQSLGCCFTQLARFTRPVLRSFFPAWDRPPVGMLLYKRQKSRRLNCRLPAGSRRSENVALHALLPSPAARQFCGFRVAEQR